jgi:hypothetical protein
MTASGHGTGGATAVGAGFNDNASMARFADNTLFHQRFTAACQSMYSAYKRSG